jgi:hypothetical protein
VVGRRLCGAYVVRRDRDRLDRERRPRCHADGSGDIAQVQAWVSDPAQNFGIAVMRPTTDGTAGHFDSSESATPPRLDVTFHLP